MTSTGAYSTTHDEHYSETSTGANSTMHDEYWGIQYNTITDIDEWALRCIMAGIAVDEWALRCIATRIAVDDCML